MIKRLVTLVILVALVMIGCHFVLDIRGIRRRQFEPISQLNKALGSPAPSTLKHLQGVGDTWQGNDCYFRFLAPSDFEKDLLENGFQDFKPPSAEEDELARKMFYDRFKLAPGMEKYFNPPWNPALDEGKRVYIKHAPDGDGTTWVLINPEGGWIHLLYWSASSR